MIAYKFHRIWLQDNKTLQDYIVDDFGNLQTVNYQSLYTYVYWRDRAYHD